MTNLRLIMFIIHLSLPLNFAGLVECHFGHVVGVGAHLELARLRVQGEVVKPHRADEVDVGGLESMTCDMTCHDMT